MTCIPEIGRKWSYFRIGHNPTAILSMGAMG
jgi:hypothetical protein